MKQQRILVIDDDDTVRQLVKVLLQEIELEVVEAADGKSGLRSFFEASQSLVILDISLPDLDGFEVLKRIRELSDVAVLMLTASSEELLKVRGLKNGADDYVTKPFSKKELQAHVEALLRRTERSPRDNPETLTDSLLAVDFGRAVAVVGQKEIHLTPLEFSLLAVFVRNPNQVLRHEQLLDLVWGDAASGTRDQLKVYVRRLRKKMSEAADIEPIETVRGFGYRYRV